MLYVTLSIKSMAIITSRNSLLPKLKSSLVKSNAITDLHVFVVFCLFVCPWEAFGVKSSLLLIQSSTRSQRFDYLAECHNLLSPSSSIVWLSDNRGRNPSISSLSLSGKFPCRLYSLAVLITAGLSFCDIDDDIFCAGFWL